MFEYWFSRWVNTDDGSRMRNPRGSAMYPKHIIRQMLESAFNAGVAMIVSRNSPANFPQERQGLLK